MSSVHACACDVSKTCDIWTLSTAVVSWTLVSSPSVLFVHTCVYRCVWAHLYVHVFVYTCMFKCCVHVYEQVFVYTCMCLCIPIHTGIHVSFQAGMSVNDD
ncbi:hypothetical protein NP493_425g03027 [Ridgeia piscesae]|uniref:Uncharacterized protein n=1 Tax=Ridgeia piscesae TaxID=27915 RepID=A0AAD9L0J0_RIDPI|nr:hypothetical protein NP493_425g03027 [Ridgeia piscesae]